VRVAETAVVEDNDELVAPTPPAPSDSPHSPEVLTVLVDVAVVVVVVAAAWPPELSSAAQDDDDDADVDRGEPYGEQPWQGPPGV
jgi:hypothetical protein